LLYGAPPSSANIKRNVASGLSSLILGSVVSLYSFQMGCFVARHISMRRGLMRPDGASTSQACIPSKAEINSGITLDERVRGLSLPSNTNHQESQCGQESEPHLHSVSNSTTLALSRSAAESEGVHQRHNICKGCGGTVEIATPRNRWDDNEGPRGESAECLPADVSVATPSDTPRSQGSNKINVEVVEAAWHACALQNIASVSVSQSSQDSIRLSLALLAILSATMSAFVLLTMVSFRREDYEWASIWLATCLSPLGALLRWKLASFNTLPKGAMLLVRCVLSIFSSCLGRILLISIVSWSHNVRY
jgi:hypothetical protein